VPATLASHRRAILVARERQGCDLEAMNRRELEDDFGVLELATGAIGYSVRA
jgi:hypothetical protein